MTSKRCLVEGDRKQGIEPFPVKHSYKQWSNEV